MTDDKNFADALKQARAATGMSQQGLADQMLIPKRTIENWEAEKSTPPPYVQRLVLNELEQMGPQKEYMERMAEAERAYHIRCIKENLAAAARIREELKEKRASKKKEEKSKFTIEAELTMPHDMTNEEARKRIMDALMVTEAKSFILKVD